MNLPLKSRNESSVSEAGRLSTGWLKAEERGGEVFDRVIEEHSEGEVSEAAGEVVDWMVEIKVETKMFEIGRKIVYWLIEVSSK